MALHSNHWKLWMQGGLRGHCLIELPGQMHNKTRKLPVAQLASKTKSILEIWRILFCPQGLLMYANTGPWSKRRLRKQELMWPEQKLSRLIESCSKIAETCEVNNAIFDESLNYAGMLVTGYYSLDGASVTCQNFSFFIRIYCRLREVSFFFFFFFFLLISSSTTGAATVSTFGCGLYLSNRDKYSFALFI